ncbi:DUF4160 domain-containing protein [Thiomicrospira sp. ALE5]|uniref:DUF4160 domain-containing protein n=1 Tax=Thiomicrospira sp. ALE5 TaxID=748650 RepID=UPI0008E5E90E|nr:DUF4160 domain-containing protein [Thiomicrospira sp. ALE5]SFR49065.1 protein of unknown function [Thiomicrospira sp. ALE5]
MPTLLNFDGFKFFFYANDHLPAHVHVLKGGSWAKIELENLEVVSSSFKPAELKKVLEIVNQHQQEFLEKWYEWFSR